MRIAGAVVLICSLVTPGQAQPNGPPARHAQGAAVCGWIGVGVSPMTRAFADSLGMAEPYGAIFDLPEAGSPAAHAGIQAGDVITAVNGTPVMRWSDFAGMIAAYAPDTRIDLGTFRNGQMIVVKVVLGSGKCPSGQRGGDPARISSAFA